MRRIVFTVVASGVLALAVPSIALARHHSRHHHHSHAKIRHEHFGATSTPVAPTPTTTTPGAVTPSTVSIASFTNGILTIKLADGSTVSGAVTTRTELECQAAASGEIQTDDHGSGGGGDNGSGGGGDEGADNGDGQQCTTAALMPGVAVGEAELSVSSAGSVWDKVELP
ncbi:MAG TPA: hypothetical protein VG186_02755 [Solirubrobacteraceae bacterium]|nr:hypothetical protein [Solirubrobacteraceae bacterium]